MQERIAAAVAVRKEAQMAGGELNLDTRTVNTEDEERHGLQGRGTNSTLGETEEIVEIIHRELSRPKSQRRGSRENQGPSFDLPFS